jgi:flagellar biogenesis protein FliO
MAQVKNNSPSRSSLSTWLIFGALGLATTLCGVILPQGLRSLHDVAAAIPTPQSPPQSEEAGVSTVQSKDQLEYNPPALPEMPPLQPMLMRLAFGTILVLILCILTLWSGKRWVRPLVAPTHESKKLRILESLPLGGRCSVFLLQADEAKILVGVDQAGIKSLLPLPQSFDRALEEMSAEKSGDYSPLISYFECTTSS